jgi:hypothetical protein
MNTYKKIIFIKNTVLLLLCLYLALNAEYKIINFERYAFIFNWLFFGVAIFWSYASFKLVPTSKMNKKAYLQVFLSMMIFLAPVIDMLMGKLFTKLNTVLFVLAQVDCVYFIGAILINFKSNLDSKKAKELLSEIFSNQKSN